MALSREWTYNESLFVHVANDRGQLEDNIRHHTFSERSKRVHSIQVCGPVFCDDVKIFVPFVRFEDLCVDEYPEYYWMKVLHRYKIGTDLLLLTLAMFGWLRSNKFSTTSLTPVGIPFFGIGTTVMTNLFSGWSRRSTTTMLRRFDCVMSFMAL